MSTPTTAPTCVIIPVYNRRSHTLQCLDLLQWCSSSPDWRIILVDDASTDGTAEAVRENHPEVIIVTGSGDLFWTGAMRLGMQHAAKLGAGVFIWLNDDTHPDEASLRRLDRIVREQPDLVLASTPIVDGEVHVCHSLKRGRAPITGAEFDVADVLAGYQVAFSRKLVQTIGFPDDQRWPHYAGDSSYTHAAHQHGFKVRIDSLSRIELPGFEPYLTVAQTFWHGDKSLGRRIHDCFIAKRSKYRLASQWHLDVLYRGRLGASLIFPARLGLWTLQIIREGLKTKAA